MSKVHEQHMNLADSKLQDVATMADAWYAVTARLLNVCRDYFKQEYPQDEDMFRTFLRDADIIANDAKVACGLLLESFVSEHFGLSSTNSDVTVVSKASQIATQAVIDSQAREIQSLKSLIVALTKERLKLVSEVEGLKASKGE